MAKYLAPQHDRPLPEAAARLIVLPAIDPAADAEKAHVRRCPQCGTLYRYLRSHEYMVNGSDDDKTARFVARTALAAWEKLPGNGETFIGSDTPWLEGYQELLDRELAPKKSH